MGKILAKATGTPKHQPLAGDLPGPGDFPYEQFRSVQQERDAFLLEWSRGQRPRQVPVIVMPGWDMWNNNTCADRELFLRWNLWGMKTSSEWRSDGVFPHLQPLYGIGVYAAAFGARYEWLGNAAPQTRPIFSRADQLQEIRKPPVGQCQPMREVLDRIHWYRQVTHDQLPISPTDTQGPNNTASTLMETNEFFIASSFQPERLEPLLSAITDVVIEFTKMQLEALGPTASLPGHQMLCHPTWKGISLSDDNVVMYRPEHYAQAALPYNSRLGKHFGGVALHSCGRVGHNAATMRSTTNLTQVEHAVCFQTKDSDPNPNPPEDLRDAYRGTGVLVKVRLHKTELDLLDRLLDPTLKCAMVVTGVESQEESERVYDAFKSRIGQITRTWPDDHAKGFNSVQS